jgi:serine/threonine-protein kinase
MSDYLGREFGPYRLEAVIGAGAMGVVYRAVHSVLQQSRAIKVLSPHLAADPTFLERFHREAQIAAGLRHRNVVLVYDVAQQDDLHYIVMDLIEGASLRELVGPGRPFPIARAIGLLRQLASAFDYAHSRRVVHRDVKPNNVIVGPDDHLTLVDFGIARAAQESRLTRDGMIVGTPEYMAPEVLAGRGGGPSADRYALGVVAYELLTGRVPFKGPMIEVARAQIHSPPPPPRGSRPTLPEWVEPVLLRQLAKDPAERYPSAGEFVAALAGPGAGVADSADDRTLIIPSAPAVAAGRTGPGTASGPPPAEDDHDTLITPRPFAAPPGRARNRGLIGAAALVGLVLAIVLFIGSRALAPEASDPTLAADSPATEPSAPAATTAPAAPAVAATARPAPTTGPAVAPQAPAAEPTLAAAPSAPAPTATAAPTPPSTAGAPAWRTVFEDRFTSNRHGWPHDPSATAWFADAAYHLFGREPGRFVAIGAPLGRAFRDVRVSGTFRKTGGPPGGGYGLIVRDQGPEPRDGLSQGGRYYVFEAGDKGEFGIWRREVTHWVEFIPWTASPAIRPDRGRNELVVEAIGPRFTFMINGTRVAAIEDVALADGGVGIYLGGDLNEVTAEHFVVQVAN